MPRAARLPALRSVRLRAYRLDQVFTDGRDDAERPARRDGPADAIDPDPARETGHLALLNGDLQKNKTRTRVKARMGARMIYRKGELSPAAVDRGWPHQVALRSDQVMRDFHVIDGFCRQLSLCARGHS